MSGSGRRRHAGGDGVMGITAGHPPRFLIGEMPPLAAEFTDRSESAANGAPRPGLSPGAGTALGLRRRAARTCRSYAARLSSRSCSRSRCGDPAPATWWSGSRPPAGLRCCRPMPRHGRRSPASSRPPRPSSVAASFVSWLAETGQPWLVVLDDLAAAADLDWVVAGRAIGPAAGDQHAGRRHRRCAPSRGPGLPRRVLQHPRGPALPDRTARSSTRSSATVPWIWPRNSTVSHWRWPRHWPWWPPRR